MDTRMNVRSMTGYGRGEVEHQGIRILTEIRSMNHRFLDIVVRLPQGWLSLEEQVRKCVQNVAKRGRIDVFVTIEGLEPPKRQLNIDWNLLTSFIKVGKKLEAELGIKADLTMADLIGKPELWMIEEVKWNVDEHRDAFVRSVEQACQGLREMRMREGENLAQDLKKRIGDLMEIVGKIEQATPLVAEHVEKRLKARLMEMLGDAEVETDRLIAEVAIWVEKADITEELTRLKSHVEQFSQTLTCEEPIGRRLDFLVQEMNREINTIGSKANLASISSWVVDCKSELEKIKEQVQNIE